jgi:signal transduction histidine kinase
VTLITRFRKICLMADSDSPAPAFAASGAVFWIAVAVLAGIVAVGAWLSLADSSGPPVAVVVLAAAVAVAAGVLLLRRQHPLLLYAAVGSAGIAVIAANKSSNPVWFATCLIAWWCALTSSRRVAVTYSVAAIAFFTAEWVWIAPDHGWGAWIGGITFTTLAGVLIGHQFELVAQLRAAQAGLAARARAEERNRIARDLHDVIAHTLTVSLLHVMSARLAIEHDPTDAARALAEAERLSRESLAEVRQVAGLVRATSDSPSQSPLPGAAELPALISRFQSAGANVTFAVDGDPSRLPATVGLALYRILQEALTNVVKHAPGAPVTARITVASGQVTLDVDSLGPAGNGTGLGLVSMRERAESLGGSCDAGPSGAGWLVRATLPLAVPEGAA